MQYALLLVGIGRLWIMNTTNVWIKNKHHRKIVGSLLAKYDASGKCYVIGLGVADGGVRVRNEDRANLFINVSV